LNFGFDRSHPAISPFNPFGESVIVTSVFDQATSNFAIHISWDIVAGVRRKGATSQARW
jgi:hypothetical protein